MQQNETTKAASALTGTPHGGEGPRIGRPPVLSHDQRRDVLIRAAGRVFLRDGFAGATMEKVAGEAGMSKRTLYRFFPDKRSALEALLSAHDHRPPMAPYAHRPGDDPREEIRRCLTSLTNYLLDPVQIGLTRLIIAEAPQYPELANSFEGLEIGGVIAHVGERFRRLVSDGAIHAENPEELADLMIGSLVNPWQILALASQDRSHPRPEEIAARIERIIDIFSDALGLEPSRGVG